MDKKVIISLNEYNSLLKDKEEKETLINEIEKNADERGYLVRHIANYWDMKDGGWLSRYNYLLEKPTIEILSKDEVLQDAQKEIKRLTNLLEGYHQTKLELEQIKNRKFWDRVFNK